MAKKVKQRPGPKLEYGEKTYQFRKQVPLSKKDEFEKAVQRILKKWKK